MALDPFEQQQFETAGVEGVKDGLESLHTSSTDQVGNAVAIVQFVTRV